MAGAGSPVGKRPSRQTRLSDLFARRRADLLDAWVQRVLGAYPEETQTFLTQKADPFDNPVGAALKEGTSDIVTYLLDGGERDTLAEKLQHLMRIRAVQQFAPAEAVGFVFQLKDVIRTRLGKDVAAGELYPELLEFESAVDDVAMVCVELYTEAREQLFRSQLKSVHRQTYKLVERMNKMRRISGEDAGDVVDDESEA